MRPWLRSKRRVAPALREELDREPGWMYAWPLPAPHGVNVLNPELDSVHRTRAEMIQPAVSEALSVSPDRAAIELACSEGWFAHRLLEWGADRVVGLDIREQNIRRATLLRDHFGIPAERLEFRQGNVLDLPLMPGETFDVVLLLGLVYHLEDPVGAVRRARALTRTLCVIESQLTRQDAPIEHGWGTTDSSAQAVASFAARVEPDAAENPGASTVGVLSLIPNRAALEQMARVSGFSRVEFVQARDDHNPQYVRGDRAVMLARP